MGLMLIVIRFLDYTGHRMAMGQYLPEPNKNYIRYEG